jgi:hypothetical protein
MEETTWDDDECAVDVEHARLGEKQVEYSQTRIRHENTAVIKIAD